MDGERHSTVCLEEAEAAVGRMREVLAQAGIKLPSLRLDPISYAREKPCPMVDLGRCTVDVANRVTAVLEAGTRTGAACEER
ncbi:hypothetical protein [Streptomyces sp. GC420]|uniref:hypothetical protein n=1 Tax=Streptomyces sp. GC420 TaxID=2697568 RepID=UPI001414EC47|nr:hypothetical protein [Streptomyces sp. GC420]NBM18233.1 hypothetical protein [Streptomyces sp. GC420]